MVLSSNPIGVMAKEIQKAAEIHLNGFAKAAKLDKFLPDFFIQFPADFRHQLKLVVGGSFWKLYCDCIRRLSVKSAEITKQCHIRSLKNIYFNISRTAK